MAKYTTNQVVVKPQKNTTYLMGLKVRNIVTNQTEFIDYPEYFTNTDKYVVLDCIRLNA